MRRHLAPFLALAVASSALALTATIGTASGAPDNDDIADAIAVAADSEWVADITGASSEAGEQSCISPDWTVWYSFTAPSAEDYVTYAVGGSFQAEMGWNDGLTTAPDCADFADSSTSQIGTRTFSASEQEYLHIAPYNHDVSPVGTTTVGIQEVLDQQDDFDDAIALTSITGSDAFAAAAALDAEVLTLETGEPNACGLETMGSNTAWFEFTPDTSRTWLVQSIISTFSGGDLAIYEGDSVDDLELLGCIDDDAHKTRHLLLQLEAATTYRIQVAAHPTDATVVVRAEPSTVRGIPVEVDDDGPGTSVRIGDHAELGFTTDGDPFIIYTDETENETRIATRTAGVWSDELLVEANNTRESDLIRLADGSHAYAYKDDNNLYVKIGSPGDWTTELVWDEVVSGADNPTIIQLADGRLAVAHQRSDVFVSYRSLEGVWSTVTAIDNVSLTLTPDSIAQAADGSLVIVGMEDSDEQIWWAESADGLTWPDAQLFLEGNDDPQPAVTATPDGTVWIAILPYDHGGFRLYERQSAGVFTLHGSDFDMDLGQYLEAESTVSFQPDPVGNLAFVATDNGMDAFYIITYDPDTQSWTFADLIPSWPTLDDGGDGGIDLEASEGDEIGFAFTNDGRPAGAFGAGFDGTTDSALYYVEDRLQALAGEDQEGTTLDHFELDGSDSSDAFEGADIVSYEWTAPAGCTVTDDSTATPTAQVQCHLPNAYEVTLTVTDRDERTHTDTLQIRTIKAFDCDDDLTADDVPVTDLPGNYADRAIICLYDIDVTTGTTATAYSPFDEVTRVQMAAFMQRLYELMTGDECPLVDTPFTDLPGTVWGDNAIACIYGTGVTTGTSATTFLPYDSVTRMQMAAFLDRLWLAIQGYSAPIVPTPFLDLPGNYADDSIARIYGLGLTTGKSATAYAPFDNVIRMNMAVFLIRFYEAVPDVSAT